MFSRIHNKLGTAGLIVAIVALIAALAGTALASAGLSGKQKKQVTKIAKKYAGKQGPAGPQGTAGPQGPAGKDGQDGTNGTNGTNGEDGSCSASVPTCVLPSKATETGLWSFVNRGTESFETEVGGTVTSHTTGIFGDFFTISFPLRIEPAPIFEWVGPGEATPGVGNCPGTVAAPEAKPGYLCLYGQVVEHAGSGTDHHPGELTPGVSCSETSACPFTPDPTSGVVGEFEIEPGKEGYGDGSWAATAG